MQQNVDPPKAALFHGTGLPWTFVAIDDAMRNDDCAIIEAEACTLCSSDIHTVMGRRVSPTPSVLGHEAIGRVVKLPSEWTLIDVQGKPIEIGQRLVWGVAASCGQCLFCQNVITQKCTKLVKYGHNVHQAGQTPRGGFSERIEIVRGTPLVALSDEIPASMACLAACAGSTVAAALRIAGNIRQKHVLVYGGGVLGVIACRMSKSLGAVSVICIEPDESRRQRAITFGATHAIDPKSEDLNQALKALTNDGFGADHAFEFSGATSAFESAIHSVRTGGKIVLAGAVFPAGAIAIEPEQIVRRMLTIQGLHNYSAIDLQSAAAFLESEFRGSPELWEMLAGKSFPIDEIQQAFDWAAANSGVRAIISMQK
jgi:alcohol dehydrogenase